MAFLMFFSVVTVDGNVIPVRAEEAREIKAQETALVPLEGIKLSKKSLLMNTGEEKQLTLSLSPADATEVPEVVWRSDDETILKVEGNGLTATLKALDGFGGTAIVTATVGEFTAECKVLVTMQEPMLESILFMQTSSGSNRYELTELGNHEYRLLIPESTSVVYVRPQLRDDIFETASITAKFTDAYTEKEVVLPLPVDESSSLSSSTTGRIIKAYNIEPKELLIEITEGDLIETYQIHIVRGSYLGSLSLKDQNDNEISYTPTFKKTVYEYSLHVPASVKTLQMKMTAAESTSTLITVNGDTAENGVYTLQLTSGEVVARIKAGDGVKSVPYEYKLTVYVDEVSYLTVKKTPETSIFSIYNAENEQIYEENGCYELIKGQSYNYTITAKGYQSQSGTFTAGDDAEKEFILEKSQITELEELDTEWGSYWKTKENQNIVSAKTPLSMSNIEVLWKQKYGSNADYTDSISDGILVENYICCFRGKTLMYLDKNTGELVKSTTMADKGNSSFQKPVYGGGMIFVALNNGKIQAFHGKTLESLWLYRDTLGGNASVALCYDDEYLYAGFADGNLVCIWTADETPDDSTEEKIPVWRKYDKGGYYRTAVYTNDKYVYACGRSGSIYCLDKKTGVTVQQITLPENRIPSTGISYADHKIYFATEDGYLYSYELYKSGAIQEEKMHCVKVGGTVYGTPLVYNGRIYLGTAEKDSYGVVRSPYDIVVVQEDSKNDFTVAYQMEIKSCPKNSGTLTLAYQSTTGCQYIYFTTDSSTGDLYLLEDGEGYTKPGEKSGLLFQQNEVSGYGEGSVLADENGILYIRYESAWMYALSPTSMYLKNVTISGGNSVLDGGESFQSQKEDHEILVDADTDCITIEFTASDGVTVFLGEQEGTSHRLNLQQEKTECEVTLKQGEDTRVYRFVIRKRSQDVSLGKLQVSYSPILSLMELELEPAFQADLTAYNASIYGSGDMQTFYLWPELPEDSKATMKVYAMEGVKEKNDGEELKGNEILLDDGVRTRFDITPESTDPVLIHIVVTAEDGKQKRTYEVKMYRNNDLPKLTEVSLLSRQKKSVTISINANMSGYVYYLFQDKNSNTGMPSSSVIRKNGKRIAVEEGINTITLEGISEEEGTVYLYEMSYAQRFSNGSQLTLQKYIGTGEVIADASGKGDLDGDGMITYADVYQLLEKVTVGNVSEIEKADMNGDGKITNADVSYLYDLIKAEE